MIKAIIYDMDDVIFNTYPLAVKIEEALLKKLGYGLKDYKEIDLSDYVGVRSIDMYKDIKEKLGIDLGIDELLNKRRKISMDIIENNFEVLPGVKYSLNLFKNKYKLAITSSGSRKRINWMLNRLDVFNYFEIIVTASDVKLGKPNPEPYLITVKKLGLKSEECLVIEDAINGIKSAKSAGCKCVAIENKYTPEQDLSEADLVLESLEDVNIKIINSISKRC